MVSSLKPDFRFTGKTTSTSLETTRMLLTLQLLSNPLTIPCVNTLCLNMRISALLSQRHDYSYAQNSFRVLSDNELLGASLNPHLGVPEQLNNLHCRLTPRLHYLSAYIRTAHMNSAEMFRGTMATL